MAEVGDWKRQAIVAQLIGAMSRHGSWCGETHIQKSVFFAQELMGVATRYPFVLYLHGPYSFDLHDDLIGMNARGFIDVVPQPPYGPSLRLAPAGQNAIDLVKKHGPDVDPQLEFVASEVSPMGVAELERLSTALFVTQSEGTAVNRPERIHQLKPHIALGDAASAVKRIDELIARTRAAPQRQGISA